MTIARTLIAVAIFLGTLQAALAHGGGPHLMGTIKSTDAKSIVVTGGDGKDVTISVDEKTTIERNAKAVALKDLKPGERVVVHTKKTDGGLVATMIKAGDAHGDHHDDHAAK